MDDQNADKKKTLSKCQKLQHYKSMIPENNLQGTTQNVRFTIVVGETAGAVSKIHIEHDK
jgi:hypothetical protein